MRERDSEGERRGRGWGGEEYMKAELRMARKKRERGEKTKPEKM